MTREEHTYEDQGIPLDPGLRSDFSFFGGGDFKPPPGRVVGVYYDKQRRIWRANWREGDVGKRKTKNFSVDDYGFEEARRLAIEYRLMKITQIAQMEINCSEIDRIRLSTSRAPAQPSSTERRKKNYSSDAIRRRKPRNLSMNGCSPYADNQGMYIPSHEQNPFDLNYNDQYNFYFSQNNNPSPSASGNFLWYYSPNVLYNLYNQVSTDQGTEAGKSIESIIDAQDNLHHVAVSQESNVDPSISSVKSFESIIEPKGILYEQEPLIKMEDNIQPTSSLHINECQYLTNANTICVDNDKTLVDK